MSTHIFCPDKNAVCNTPASCLQTCKATCPPCTSDCNQGRNCTSTLTTSNGGNVITKGEPMPARPKQFQPDYGITRAQYKTSLTPLGYVLAIWAVLMFVFYVVRHA